MSTWMRLRRSSSMTVLVLFALLLNACGGSTPATPNSSGSTSSDSASTAPTAASEPAAAQPTAASEPAAAQTTAETSTGTTANGDIGTGKITVWLGNYTPTPKVQEAALSGLKPTAAQQIADEYIKLHPGVEIEWLDQPGPGWNDWQTYIKTNGAGGTLPDIFYTMPQFATNDSDQGWYLDLSDAMNKPNPYVQGSTTAWKDNFILNNTMQSIDNHYWSVVMGLSGVNIYYNKDIFAELGYNQPPQTYAEMMDLLKKASENGYKDKTFLWNGGSWMQDVLADQLLTADKAEFDFDKNGTIEVADILTAYKSGRWGFGSEAYTEYLKLLHDVGQYGYKGEVPDQTAEFLKGEVPMMNDGIWNVGRINKDPNRKFEIGTFYYPRLTKDTTALAGDVQPYVVGGATGLTLAVAKTAQDKGVDKIAVDFLRFLSTPEHASKLLDETEGAPANVKDTTPLPLFANFLDQLKARPESQATFDGVAGRPDPIWGSEANDNIGQLKTAYLQDQITLEDFVQQAKEWQDKGIDETIERYKLTDDVNSRMATVSQ